MDTEAIQTSTCKVAQVLFYFFTFALFSLCSLVSLCATEGFQLSMCCLQRSREISVNCLLFWSWRLSLGGRHRPPQQLHANLLLNVRWFTVNTLRFHLCCFLQTRRAQLSEKSFILSILCFSVIGVLDINGICTNLNVLNLCVVLTLKLYCTFL